MFPVTIGGVTYNLADFYPLGYVTALPNSIASIYDELLKLTTGTSTTSMTLGSTTTLTTQTNLRFDVGQRITIAESTSPATRYVEATVNSYNPSTGVLVFNIYRTVGSGTFASWVITSTMWGPNDIALGVSFGGFGDSSADTIKNEVGINYPTQCMQRIFEDFDKRLTNNDYQYPWYPLVTIAGAGAASISTIPMITTDANAQNNAGVLVLNCTGTAGSQTLNYGRTFLGYGLNGFMNASQGGTIDCSTTFRVSHLPTTTDVYRTRFGLRGNGNSTNPNFFDFYGLGFEIAGDSEGGKIVVVFAKKGSVVKVNTGYDPSVTGWTQLRILIDTFEQQAYWYIGSLLVYTGDMSDWPNETASLLHPAFSHETLTANARQAYFDYLYCTHRIARRVF